MTKKKGNKTRLFWLKESLFLPIWLIFLVELNRYNSELEVFFTPNQTQLVAIKNLTNSNQKILVYLYIFLGILLITLLFTTTLRGFHNYFNQSKTTGFLWWLLISSFKLSFLILILSSYLASIFLIYGVGCLLILSFIRNDYRLNR